MPDYSKGKLYIIRSYKTDDIYIGSTCSPLSVRMCKHRSDYKSWTKTNKKYMTSFEILKNNDAYIELHSECPSNNRDLLNKKEGELIRSTECVNKIMIGRTQKEYRQDNLQVCLDRCRNYKNNNKKKCKESFKQYYNDNKSSMVTRASEYRSNNSQLIKCDYCLSSYKKYKMTSHIKTGKHIKNYKLAYFKCWDVEFTGVLTSSDY